MDPQQAVYHSRDPAFFSRLPPGGLFRRFTFINETPGDASLPGQGTPLRLADEQDALLR